MKTKTNKLPLPPGIHLTSYEKQNASGGGPLRHLTFRVCNRDQSTNLSFTFDRDNFTERFLEVIRAYYGLRGDDPECTKDVIGTPTWEEVRKASGLREPEIYRASKHAAIGYRRKLKERT